MTARRVLVRAPGALSGAFWVEHQRSRCPIRGRLTPRAENRTADVLGSGNRPWL